MPESSEKSAWDRGKDALEILMHHFPVADLEKLAAKVQEKPELATMLRQMLADL